MVVDVGDKQRCRLGPSVGCGHAKPERGLVAIRAGPSSFGAIPIPEPGDGSCNDAVTDTMDE